MHLLVYIEDLGIGGQQSFNYHLFKYMDKSKITIAYHLDGAFRNYFELITDNLIQLAPPPQNWAKGVKNPLHVSTMGFKLAKLIKKSKIDMVITNATYTYMIGAFAKVLTGCKLGRILGSEPDREPFYWKYFHFIPIHRVTNAIFGFSIANKMLQHRGVASDKLHDIGNAVDTDLFAPTLSKEEIKKRQEGFGIPDNCIVLGWPGRVSAETEILNSLKLLIELKSLNFNHFRFLIIGDGAYLGEVKKFIDNNDLTQYVVYLGWQSIDEMKLCIQLLDVVPLLRADVAGGSKLREAMASGVIALSVNDIGGFQKTWITDGETGVLVSPINFIHNAALRVIELYQNPVLANHIRVQGRKYAVESLAFKNKSKLVQDVCEALCKKQ